MTHPKLLRQVRARTHDLQREAEQLRLARTAVRGHPTHSLEHVYYLSKALFWFATALPAALSVLLLQSRGFTLLEVGLYLGVYSLTVAVLEVPSGTLADSWGRKRTALLSYTLLIAAQGVLLWAFSAPLLLAWAMLYGAGRALVSGALEAWFVDAVARAAPGTELQPLFAKAGTAELFALTLGTLAGGALPGLFAGLPEGAVLSPLSVVLVASAVVKGVLIGLVLWGVQETRPAGTSRAGFRAVFVRALSLSRRSPALKLLFGGALSSGFALAGLETFWQPRFAALLGPDTPPDTLLLSAILAGSFGAGMLGNLASIPLCRLLGGRYALVAALTQGLGGLSVLALAVQTQAVPATALFWLVYLIVGVSGSPLQTLLNRVVPSGERAALLSVASLVTYVGFFAGSVGLGALAEQVSVAAAWGLAGAVLLGSTGFYLRLASPTHTPSPLRRAG
jgi:MFS transporter, DHA1 family, quinolone resistance protein